MINSQIIKEMRKKCKEKTGLPIVAVVFNDDLDVIFSESNDHIKPKKPKWNFHAEWILMENNKEEDLANKNIIITTSPCRKCLERMIDIFAKIYFLFEKFNPNEDDSYYLQFDKIKKMGWENHFKDSKKKS